MRVLGGGLTNDKGGYSMGVWIVGEGGELD
jgi:hypothetical protein